MATVDEVAITGRKFRAWDAVNQIWKRVSYWTHASDVELDSGHNVQFEIEDINSRLSSHDSTIQNIISDVDTRYDYLNGEVQNLNNVSQNLSTQKISKSNLVFSLSGNDLYITKTY